MAYHTIEDGPWPQGVTVAVYPVASVDVGSPIDTAIAQPDGTATFGGLTEGAQYTAVGSGGTQTFYARNQESALGAVESRVLSPTTILYVDATNGSDANDGRSPGVGGAFATWTAAYDALPAAGGKLRLTNGLHGFTTKQITKPVVIEGDDWWSNVNAAFGDAAWNLPSSGFKGTVLKSTATSGKALDIAFSSGKLTLKNLTLVGPGTGTSTGLALGSAVGIHGAYLENVLVCNFSKGWDLDLCLDSTFVNAWARGCQTGMRLNNSSNQNEFLNTQVQFSSVDGIVVGDSSSSAGNNFRGGLLQNVSGTAGVRVLSGSNGNNFEGFWNESVTATDVFKFESGAVGNRWQNAYYSSTVGNLGTNAGTDSRLGPIYTVTGGKVLTLTSTSNRAVLDGVGLGGNTGTVTDAGFNTTKLGFGVERIAVWLADNVTSATLGQIPQNALPLRVGLIVTEAFDSSGTDMVKVGGNSNANRYASDTDVSTTGTKTLAAGSSLTPPGFIAGGDTVTATYTAGGSAPTTGKALVWMEYTTVPSQIA